MASRRPCSICGTPRWIGPTSRPDIVCHECRRSGALRTPCVVCGKPISRKATKYCSMTCFGKVDGARRRARRGATTTAKSRRVDRDLAAVGLNHHARRALLAGWKRQGRQCAYCPALATTVDHVIPLIRGGTNHEGNLVPACRSCNSRKQDRLVIEFRYGLPAGLTAMPFRVRSAA